MGRPSSYTPEIAETICRRLAEGESLRAVCRDEGMPSASAVLDWRNVYADFAVQYARAREAGYQLLAEDLLDIADETSGDTVKGAGGVDIPNSEWITRSRLRVDTRKWLLSKMLPKVYGDKVEHTGADGGPISFTWQKPAE